MHVNGKKLSQEEILALVIKRKKTHHLTVNIAPQPVNRDPKNLCQR